ncbi:bifunctional riboflavin kinase/FAD synthetase [Schnuerera sp. xch1]|uniref:bifunctional riboflavin kinase/FAD synthetase n=1 Tax=Schnuerera sp. xch1 TaxID=2874283 RepID=UPI001CBED27E|nr:bifunctional riboflavin kinase/FAD synthetase [Schnuerera sp. xch1]MBZ2173829.1 bifunctional riboflavin kinase/FAD synthetase [Schnuerera sp. xch1]
MEIIDLNTQKAETCEISIALGNFDGIHIGHQYLIKDNIRKAKDKNLKSSVLLFKNHTKTILKKDKNSKIGIITSYSQKLKLLKELGVEIVYTIDFDKNVMKLTPEEFIKDILLDKLNTKLVTVGFNYRFGNKASGDSKYLKTIGMKEGFEVNIIKPIYIDNEIVSSTNIRNLIRSGDIDKANSFLNRSYSVLGIVVEGTSRGRKLGFPTANIKLNDNYVVPHTGVYKTITMIDDKKYLSLTNIGYNPTFDGDELKIETYILNFRNNIYGKLIEINFDEFIRDDIKFSTAGELIKQMKKDVEHIK